MAIKNTRKIKGLGDVEVYSMINAVHMDKSANEVTLEVRHFKDESTRQADIKDYLGLELVRLEGEYSEFAAEVDVVAKGYDKAKEKDDSLADGIDV